MKKAFTKGENITEILSGVLNTRDFISWHLVNQQIDSELMRKVNSVIW